MKGLIVKASAVVISLLSLCVRAYPQDCYPNPPQILEATAQIAAQQVVNDLVNKNKTPEEAAKAIGQKIQSLVLYAVGDAIAPDRNHEIYSLKKYEYIGETARTDKQIGASARAEGSTSAVEKPGFAELLGFAIEHGAIQKRIDGTSLTLSTTPYAFIAWANKGDTAELYRQNEFFTRVGLSASFNISNKDQPLADVNNKQLTEWSIRMRLAGDRSARSKEFQEWWAENIRPKINDRLAVLVTGFGDLLDEKLDQNAEDGKRVSSIVNDVQATLQAQIKLYLESHTSELPAEKTTGVKQLILCTLKDKIVEPVRSNQIKLSPELRAKLNDKLFPSLAAAHAALEQAREDFNKFWESFSKGPLTTFAFTNHRTSMGSDYSEFAFLHEQATLRPLKLVANGWVSIYSNPDRTMNQQQVRDYGAALSFQGEANSPFLTETPDLSKMTFAFTGRYQRTKENEGVAGKKADIAIAQFRMEIPIRMGLSIPLSVTYANATELIKEKHVRGNFGLTLDVDKLFALTRRVLNP
ncbi:MAG: hypothetical protein AABN33_06160 [Acidobacteriota bacterium]